MIKFVKAHAYGNDFLYVRDGALGDIPLDAFTRAICERHSGVGADGVILYKPTEKGASMVLLNADGSRAEVSGNGVRGLAALLLREDDRPNAGVLIETEGGVKDLTRLARDGSRHTFRASMGKPTGLTQARLLVGDEPIHATLLNIGNPQCVVLGPLPEDERFSRLGKALERHSLFADGTNVEFAEVETPRRIRIRIWERGVGPTQSSGTGSCAALVAAAAFGGAAQDAEVVAPGGAQRVEWTDEGVFLTGWAEILFEGIWLPQFARTTA